MTKKSSSVRKTNKKDSDQRSAVSNQVVEQVRELAWTGQHAKAIELASQSMSKFNFDPRQMDLLDLRAESYIARLNLDAAERDVSVMQKLAKAKTNLAWKAQSLIYKARVQWFQGKTPAKIVAMLRGDR